MTCWCKTGKLAAIPEKFGSRTSFKIPQAALALWFQAEEVERLQAENLKLVSKERRSPETDPAALIPKFRKACLQGVLNGRPFSPYTARYYCDHMNRFFQRFRRLSYASLKDMLLDIEAEQFATRDKLYKAAICFAKFLVLEQLESESLVEELRPLKPRRHKPPKRITIAEDGLEKMLAACEDLEDRLLVTLLAHTGLRAGEYGSLKRRDLDLATRTLTVACGKGGKSRVVGISNALVSVLEAYLEPGRGFPAPQ